MLQMMWAHQQIKKLSHILGDDSQSLQHTQKVVDAQFHEMNTDIHWLTLFLHPLCHKFVISNSPHSQKLNDAYDHLGLCYVGDGLKRW